MTLHSKCLVLDDGTLVAIVICDNLGISRDVYDEARKLIAEQLKIPADQILMAATHSLSNPREFGKIPTKGGRRHRRLRQHGNQEFGTCTNWLGWN